MSVMRCKNTFFAVVDGRERRVRAGELLGSDDPVVKRFSSSFEPVEEYVAKHRAAEPVVERATAEPGEKRSVGRPRKAPKLAELTPESAPKTAADAAAAGVQLDETTG
jgi:hypothetical protein